MGSVLSLHFPDREACIHLLRVYPKSSPSTRSRHWIKYYHVQLSWCHDITLVTEPKTWSTRDDGSGKSRFCRWTPISHLSRGLESIFGCFCNNLVVSILSLSLRLPLLWQILACVLLTALFLFQLSILFHLLLATPRTQWNKGIRWRHCDVTPLSGNGLPFPCRVEELALKEAWRKVVGRSEVSGTWGS